jgi:microsomal epoxide hydrolase
MIAEISNTRFTSSDGVQLHVFEAGLQHAGPVIAFVPGWSMPAAIWRAQLAELGATHRVAALDPRGQGESDVPPGGYNIDRRADDLHEFVARYPHVVLIGWSLGALETLQYVHRHGTAALEALVLIDSSVGEDPLPEPGSSFQAALKDNRRAAIGRFVRDMFRTPRPAAELAALTDSALRMPLEASLSLFPRTYPREHWRNITRAFARPLLYIVTPQFAGQADALQRHRPATCVSVFEEAGHALFVDEPERFNRLIADFVGNLSRKLARPCPEIPGRSGPE